MYKALAISAATATGYVERGALGHEGDVTSLEFSIDNGQTWQDFTTTHTAEAAQNSTNGGYTLALRGNGGTGLGAAGGSAIQLGVCSNIELIGSEITIK